MSPPKQNKAGFGLIEMLVAVGIMGIAMYGFMTMLVDANKAQRGLQAKEVQREVMAEIRTLLNNKTACLNSFGGSNPAPGFVKDTIIDSNNVVRFEKNKNDQSNLLKFIEFKIEDWDPALNLASLTVKLEKQGNILGVKQIQTKIKLKLKLTAGNITECFSIGSNSDSFWQVDPANASNIYYSGGNIGIGTDTPAALLDVAGSIRPGSAGIATGTACGAEGAMAYDLATHAPVFCNQTGNWAAVGGMGVQDCVGAWGACVGISKTYIVTTPAFGAGSVQCPFLNGETASCGYVCVCPRPTTLTTRYATDQTGLKCLQDPAPCSGLACNIMKAIYNVTFWSSCTYEP